MIEFMAYVLSDFWRFLGFLIIWILTCVAVSNIRIVDIHINNNINEDKESED